MRLLLKLLALMYVFPFKLIGIVAHLSVIGLCYGWYGTNELVDYLDERKSQ